MDKANYISSLTFSVTKNDELSELSSVNITAQLYSSASFKRNILAHPSFGPDAWGNQTCTICHEKYKNCNGHLGSFDQVLMYKTLYVPYVVSILNQICHNCRAITDKRQKMCLVCKTPKIKFFIYKYISEYKTNKVDPIQIAKKLSDTASQIVPREQIYSILSNISYDTLQKLGYKHILATDLLSTTFPILGKKYRKDNKVGDKVMKNHIDSLYQQLTRLISEKTKVVNNPDKLAKIQNAMQVIEMQLVDGDKYRRSDGSPNNTILPRLMKKEGMIIADMITMRASNCIRSVIIPSSELISINEVGIPKIYAKQLIVYEYVTADNIHSLTSMLNNKDYPRIKFREEKLNNEVIERSAIGIDKLSVGDLIARDLIEGDPVLINRQPTLSKNSILCLKTHIIAGKSLSIPLATCDSFNADFDGDQMNVFIPKYPVIRNECFMKMSTSDNIFSGAFSGIIIAIKQDITAGLRALTSDHFFVDELYKNFIIRNIKVVKEINPIDNLFSGKDIFSTIIPVNFNADIKDDKGKLRIKIVNGFLVEGVIDKYSVMKQQKGLINAICEIYGEIEAIKFIDNMYIIGSNFLKIYGLTTGLQDFYFNTEQMEKITVMRNIRYKNLYNNLNKYDYLNPIIDKVITSEIEKIMNINSVLTNIMKTEFHHFHDIVTSGAKGKDSEINKICYTNGQVNIGPKRYTDRSPFAAKFDNSSEIGLGIIESSYIDGFTSMEVQMGNQKAVSDTASTQLATAQPGYMNLKLNEVTRDYEFLTDFTIRDPQGNILIQHYFNSFDPEKETSYTIEMNIDVMKFNEDEYSEYNLDPETADTFNEYIYRIYHFMKMSYNKLNKYEVQLSTNVYLPFDFDIIYQNMSNKGDVCKDMKFVIDRIDYILSNYNTSLFSENDNVNKIPMTYALYNYLHPKNIKLTKEAYIQITDTILRKIIYAQIEPGTPILIKSGTCYNSVVTQDILNSIHHVKTKDPLKSLNDNFNVSKSVRNEVISTYVDGNVEIFNRLILKDIVSEIKCEFTSEKNKRVYKIFYVKGKEPTNGFYFTFRFDVKEMIEKRVLLSFIFTNVINNIDLIISKESSINKQINYLHVSSSALDEYPSISILVHGDIPNVRVFINNFVSIVKNINIRDTNIKSVFIEEREFKYKRCTIEGISLEEASTLKFVKRDHILTSNLYAVYEIYGIISYLSASMINLFNIGKDKNVNPKHGAALSCVICQNNTLVSLNRQGFDKIAVGPLPKIAFESQGTNLIKSALKNSTDFGRAINSQQMFGHKHKIGTNHAIITYDINKIKQLVKYKVTELKENQLYNDIKQALSTE